MLRSKRHTRESSVVISPPKPLVVQLQAVILSIAISYMFLPSPVLHLSTYMTFRSGYRTVDP